MAWDAGMQLVPWSRARHGSGNAEELGSAVKLDQRIGDQLAASRVLLGVPVEQVLSDDVAPDPEPILSPVIVRLMATPAPDPLHLLGRQELGLANQQVGERTRVDFGVAWQDPPELTDQPVLAHPSRVGMHHPDPWSPVRPPQEPGSPRRSGRMPRHSQTGRSTPASKARSSSAIRSSNAAADTGSWWSPSRSGRSSSWGASGEYTSFRAASTRCRSCGPVVVAG